MKTIILSFFTLFSLFVDIQEKTKNIGFSNGILEMSLCWIFFYFYYKKERKIKSKSFMVVSVIFSVCMLIGNSFASTGDFTLLYRTPMHFGLQLCRFVGYIFFFKTGLSYVYTYLKKYKKSFPYQRGIKWASFFVSLYLFIFKLSYLYDCLLSCDFISRPKQSD